MAGIDAELAMASPPQSFTPSASNSPVSCGRASIKLESTTNDPFPAGLRVLVVDDDPTCLLILDRMLRRCLYHVTPCARATVALEMLREHRENFDLIISDVCMPDMDGFKLLELVGLEMDLPVIMMSANGETSAVMKGIKHGACDYLLKPVRIEELRNIWQHVVRRKWRISGHAASQDDSKQKRAADDGDHTSSANEGLDGIWKQSKRRRDMKEEEEDGDQDTDDNSTTKKPRVVWSVDLHQQFVGAVNQLGIDKAVPKRILELMNVNGLTRENVASHLQKYRLYLKRISGVGHQPGGFTSSFAGSSDFNFGGPGGLGDLRTLAAAGQLSPQALLSLQAGVLGRLSLPNNLGLGGVDPMLLLQLAGLQGANKASLARSPHGQQLLSDQGNLLSGTSDTKHLAQGSQQLASFGQLAGSLDKGPAGISTLQQQQQLSGLGGIGQLVGVNSNPQGNPKTSALTRQALQQQAGVCLTSGGSLNLPSGGNLGQHGFSTEMGTCFSSPYSVNSVTASIAGQSSSVLRSSPGSPLAATCSSSPNVIGSSGTTSCGDPQVLQVAAAGAVNLQGASPIVVSPQLGSVGQDDSLCGNMLKDVGVAPGALSDTSRQTLNNFGSSFAPLPEIKHGFGVNMGQRNQVGWQGFCLRQDFSQCNSLSPRPRYGQVSSSSQGQSRASPLIAEFLGNLDMDGCSKTTFSTATQSDHFTAGRDLKLRDPIVGVLMGSKSEHGLLPEHLSDDFLNIVFKQQQQQQEGSSLTE